MTINFKILEKELDKYKKEGITIPREPQLSLPQTNEALEGIRMEFNLPSIETTLILVAILFQKGGTARKCDGNLEAQVGEHKLKLANVRNTLKKLNYARMERKLARSLATQIQNIAERLGLPGNLANAIINRQELTEELSDIDKSWLSDFQSGNPDCPHNLRMLITKHFSNMPKQAKQKPKK
jgi:hypothetical protein